MLFKELMSLSGFRTTFQNYITDNYNKKDKVEDEEKLSQAVYEIRMNKKKFQ